MTMKAETQVLDSVVATIAETKAAHSSLEVRFNTGQETIAGPRRTSPPSTGRPKPPPFAGFIPKWLTGGGKSK